MVVLKFRPRKPRVIRKLGCQGHLVESFREENVQLEEIVFNVEDLDFNLRFLNPIVVFINNLGERIYFSSVIHRRESMKKFPTEALREVAIKSTCFDWKRDPIYYKALVLELRSRRS